MNKELEFFLAAHPDTTHLDVLIIDLCDNAIGKRLPASAMPAVFAKGTPVCGAMQLVDVMGNTDDPMGYGFSDGDPDAFAMPIEASLCPVPWLGGGKSQVLREFFGSVDGKALWYEPRQVLKKVVQRFDDLGIKPVVAFELEFYLLAAGSGADDVPVTAASPRTGIRESSGKVLSLDKLDEFDVVLGAIEEANPYLVLAGVHHGLSADLDAAEKYTGNAGTQVDPGLPLRLWRALDAIRQAKILPDYLGADYLQIYADVKMAEFDAPMAAIHPREYEWYL